MKTNRDIFIGAKALIILMLCSPFIACSSSDDLDDELINGNNNYLLQKFTIVSGDKHYSAKINQEDKEATFSMFTSPREVDEVSYQLAEGATITPKPDTISTWGKSQVFKIVSGSDSSTYTILMPNLRDIGVYKSVGYIPAGYGSLQERIGDIPWQHLTHICITFLYVGPDGIVNPSGLENMEQIKTLAHANGVKVLISLSEEDKGDWPAGLLTPERRTRAVTGIMKYIEDNNLDGVDVDYEHYATWDNDFPNTFAFIKELSAAIKSNNLLMSCATNANYEYTTEWHQYFDFINLMSYDGNGTGRAIPVNHGTMEQWHWEYERWYNDFDTPREKLIGGIPFYGYTWDNWSNMDGPLLPSGFTRAICDIVEHYNGLGIPVSLDGERVGNTLYNGRDLIREKCVDVLDKGYGGVMIWQILHDMKDYDDKMMKVIGDNLPLE